MHLLKRPLKRKKQKKKSFVVKVPFLRKQKKVKRKKIFSMPTLGISLFLHVSLALLFFKFLSNTLFNLNIDTQYIIIQTKTNHPLKIEYVKVNTPKPVIAKISKKNSSVKKETLIDQPLMPKYKFRNEESTTIVKSTSPSKIYNEPLLKNKKKIELNIKPVQISKNNIFQNKTLEKKTSHPIKLEMNLAPSTLNITTNTVNSSKVSSNKTPQRIKNKAPSYPKLAQRLGHSGKVEFKVWIKANGKIAKTELHSSSGSKILDRAAKKAIVKYEFEENPNGMSIAIIPIVYKLN